MPYKTEGHLQEAFGGESKANRRYLFFAEKADKEGHPGVARLFRAVAEAETVHARNHFNVMGGVGSTVDNVTAASIGEHQEFTSMYPVFIDDAREERNEKAQRTFEWANAVEKAHHGLFEAALAELKAGGSPGAGVYHVCQLCGYTVAGDPPEKCPVCGAAMKMFKKME
jgi:rubrerythrin